MNEHDVKRLVLVLAVQAEIEGMKSANNDRLTAGHSMAYDETSFREMAERFYTLANAHNDQL
jgi:hypothetical protein